MRPPRYSWKARGLAQITAEQAEAAAQEGGLNRSEIHLVGRPWLERRDDTCGFIVAGEGIGALACGAPGRPRRRGWGSCCAQHAGEMYVSVVAQR